MKRPHGKWKWYDFVLFDAAGRAEDELCNKCGLPVYICRTDESDLIIDVRVDYCKGDVAIARKRKEMTPKDGQLPDGITFHPDPYSMSARALSDYRKPYWDTVLANRKELQSERDERVASYLENS